MRNNYIAAILLTLVILLPVPVKMQFITELIVGSVGIAYCLIFKEIKLGLSSILFGLLLFADLINLLFQANSNNFNNITIFSIGDKVILLIWSIIATSLVQNINKVLIIFLKISIPFMFVITSMQMLNSDLAMRITYKYYNTAWTVVDYYWLVKDIQRGVGTFEHPTSLAIYSFLSLVFIAYHPKAFNRKTIKAVYIIMSLVMGFLSLSKTFVVLIVVASIVQVVKERFSLKILGSLIAGVSTVGIIGYFINSQYAGKAYNPIQENVLSAFSINGLFSTRFGSDSGMLAPLLNSLSNMNLIEYFIGNSSASKDVFVGDSQYFVVFFQNGLIGLVLLILLMLLSMWGYAIHKQRYYYLIFIMFTGIGFTYLSAPRLTVVLVVIVSYGINLLLKPRISRVRNLNLISSRIYRGK